MNILLVGGAGYIGSAYTDIANFDKVTGASEIEGWVPTTNVRIYDNLTFSDFYLKGGVEFVNGDVRDKELLKKNLEWADTVVWLAAHVGDGACAVNPAVSLEVNKYCVKFLVENFNGRIIFPSTCSVYGCQDGLLNEDSPINPLSLYAYSKAEAEKYLINRPNSVILRLGTVFGLAGEFGRPRFDLVVNTLLTNAYLYKKLIVNGGNQYRPLVDVYEVAAIMYFLTKQDNLNGSVYNVANRNYTILEMANAVKKIVPDCELVINNDSKFEDLRNYKVDNSKLLKDYEDKWASYDQSDLSTLMIPFWNAISSGRIKVGDYGHNHNFFKRVLPFDLEKFPVQDQLQKELSTLQISSVL